MDARENMAGRGTDIKLGGNPEHIARKRVGSDASPEEFKAALLEAQEEYFTGFLSPPLFLFTKSCFFFPVYFHQLFQSLFISFLLFPFTKFSYFRN